MKRIAIAARVSTNRQEKEATIESQIAELEFWASENDCVIVERYIDDGWSGEILARPELDRLRDDASKGIWESVVFVDRDRLARKLSLQELVIDELVEKDVEIIFLNEPLADNPEGRIMQQIKGVFAEYERAKIAERMRRGKIHNANEGKLVTGTPPYGYKYFPKTKTTVAKYEIYQPEAEIVRMIFKWVAEEGYSMRQVVKELFKRKIPPAKRISKRWVKSSVERLLNRQDYIGTSYYNKTVSVVPKHPQNVGKYKKIKKSSRRMKPKEDWIAIPVPPIINKELFKQAHLKLQENKIYNRRNKKYDYLLSGKVFCTSGHKRVGDSVNGHYYYRCAERIYKFPLPHKCDAEGVNAQILDGMVWYKLLTLLSKPQVVRPQVERWKEKQSKVVSRSQEEIERLNLALDKLREEEERHVKVYGAGFVTFEKLQDDLQDLKAKKEAIESQIKETGEKAPDDEVNLDRFDDICTDIFYTLKYAHASEKQRYARNLLVSIYVGERRSALVNGHIPLVTQAQNIQDVLIGRHSRFAECRQKHAF
ncbi:MAG: hypothetical protein UT84_C0015G0005 [Candidatus Curtissbacteria bacterium GW2011_GWA1_40_16]|uniref:Recombinase family protein n=1 Tax=Candidatus Curtissbacteria bacterium GW2011_GWA1_40_16 TaxID=1618405 RepID=A0A0G0UIN9_9BACT|nr:MAG: hypothetical protein UT84_C0015G0005 [Candidatus Curtissbacteria bacterium GW2011_GWA1_40_16]